MIVFILCFILFLVGLFGILTSRNIIFLVLIGYIDKGEAPILIEGIKTAKYVDPLPQAMVLTAIVIGLATNAMLLTMAIRIYKKYNTFDIRKVTSLKG